MEWLLVAAGSTDRCNTFRKLLSWGLIEQGLSGSFIELPCDCAELGLATFRRKIGALGRVVKGAQQRKTRRERPAGGFTEPDGEGGRIYRVARFSIARPMLMRLSAMTPRPTQRFIPASPLYRQRLSPCRRFATLMRPSHPV